MADLKRIARKFFKFSGRGKITGIILAEQNRKPYEFEIADPLLAEAFFSYLKGKRTRTETARGVEFGPPWISYFEATRHPTVKDRLAVNIRKGAPAYINPNKAKFLARVISNYDPTIGSFENAFEKAHKFALRNASEIGDPRILKETGDRIREFKKILGEEAEGRKIRKVVLHGGMDYEKQTTDPRALFALLSERESKKKLYGRYFTVSGFEPKSGTLYIDTADRLVGPDKFEHFNQIGLEVAKKVSSILGSRFPRVRTKARKRE